MPRPLPHQTGLVSLPQHTDSLLRLLQKKGRCFVFHSGPQTVFAESQLPEILPAPLAGVRDSDNTHGPSGGRVGAELLCATAQPKFGRKTWFRYAKRWRRGRMPLVCSATMPKRTRPKQLYLDGVYRNINAILAGVFGASSANRARGEKSSEVLFSIIQNESLSSVVERLLRHESRVEKQGQASLHDLALGHAILARLISRYRPDDTAKRSTSTHASSMGIGQIVGDLRRGYELLAEAYPDLLIAELTEEQLRAGLDEQFARIEAGVSAALKNEGRAKNLAHLEDVLTVANLMKYFSWAVDEGLDGRPIDDFLGS